MKHIPVMLNEVLQIFDPQPGEIYIDCTFGGGGHTKALLDKGCTVIAIDRDIDAKKYADELSAHGYNIWFYNRIFSQIEHIRQQWMWEYSNVKYNEQIMKKLSSNVDYNEDSAAYFGHREKVLEEMIKNEEIPQPQISGILADFGICTHQFHNKKGFSFKNNDPLDMRMGRSKLTASDILHQYTEHQLSDMFFFLSDEKHSRVIASKIIALRGKQPITHMFDLLSIFPPQSSSMHPATKVLQALRIEVNQELKEIHELLHNISNIHQKENIKIICMSFHSGEDRIVKTIFNQWNDDERCSQLSKKLLTPSESEIKSNPASRSAKLRHCQLIPQS